MTISHHEKKIFSKIFQIAIRELKAIEDTVSLNACFYDLMLKYVIIFGVSMFIC
uniref:Uncharacterized protein n=1 Tax=Arundo donax TaxID=35708 RepID=A0A0A8Z1E0_ARUDO